MILNNLFGTKKHILNPTHHHKNECICHGRGLVVLGGSCAAFHHPVPSNWLQHRWEETIG